MADRAAVSLDQTASPHPPLSRQQRQRNPPPDLCRDDRLRAAAHRRPPPLRQDLDPPLHRSGRPVPLPTPPPRHHRQTPARQPKPPTMPKLQKSIEPQLCLSFPGQPCACGEREETLGGDIAKPERRSPYLPRAYEPKRRKNPMRYTITPLTPHTGAEVRGLDLNEGVD